MAEIVTETRDASTARVPAVPPGTAVVYTRFEREKAVVLNPLDFHRLTALDHDLDALSRNDRALSGPALDAHAIEDRPGVPVEDALEIRALLGL